MLLLVALLLNVRNEALEVQHQEPRGLGKLRLQQGRRGFAVLAFRLDSLCVEVAAKHSLDGELVDVSAEVQREVSEPLNHLPMLPTLRARQLLQQLRIEVVLRGKHRFLILRRSPGQPVLVTPQKLVVKLVDVLQEELVGILLAATSEHWRSDGDLLSKLGRAQRCILRRLQALQDVNAALEERAVGTMGPSRCHRRQLSDELARCAYGLGDRVQVARIA
mmetsp:Transcript_36109/g.84463  ORF Transcript_36109/g.84463 Transcript_36109/m.84463 type:complete len:220 (-) Transcript_36109:683-1342(-)